MWCFVSLGGGREDPNDRDRHETASTFLSKMRASIGSNEGDAVRYEGFSFNEVLVVV
jgi:hypothetical protein